MNKAFEKYLLEWCQLDKEIVDAFLKGCSCRKIEKGTLLIKEGDYCRNTYWIESGLLIKYGIDDKGKKHVLQFAPESWWITDRACIFKNVPASYFIETIEDSSVVYFDDKLILDLCVKYPKFNFFHNSLLQNHIRHLTNRVYRQLSASAEERYLSFINLHPNLFHRAPLSLIASYLGVTPECVSRVRRDLTKNKKD